MKRIFCTLVLLTLTGLSMAQTRPGYMTNGLVANLPAQEIGVNDLISVSVYRSPELTRTVRVNSSGAITLPLLKEPIQAAGLMPKALEGEITRALKEGGILVNPVVEVTVAEYSSRPISVMGAVKKPLTFQAVGRVTLLDALAKAEGLAPAAAGQVLVTLPPKPGHSDPLIRRIPVKGLIDGAQPELNLQLNGGEEVRVPEAGKIFVVGNVKKPGQFPIPDPADATVMKMIALAEGLTPYHRKQAYIYRKEPETGVKQEIEIELAQIMKRKLPDVPLEIDDVLYIPDNSGKRATMRAIERAIGFGSSTVSGILIWGGR